MTLIGFSLLVLACSSLGAVLIVKLRGENTAKANVLDRYHAMLDRAERAAQRVENARASAVAARGRARR